MNKSSTTAGYRGFVYVAFGEKYVREAAESARRVSAIHPYPILLITDKAVAAPEIESAFNEVRVLPLKCQYSDKILMKESPYEKTIFLDSDTLVQETMDPLFDMLDHFDLALQFTEGGNHYTIPGVPTCFYEPSAGIIAWKKSEAMSKFFVNWRLHYDQMQEREGRIGAWDQRSLRQTLYLSRDVRFVPLPTECQFYTYRPNVVAGPILMVHGRGLTGRILHTINASGQFRIWLPKVGYVPHYPYATVSELCGFAIRYLALVARVCLRRMLAATRIWPYPKNQRPA